MGMIIHKEFRYLPEVIKQSGNNITFKILKNEIYYF